MKLSQGSTYAIYGLQYLAQNSGKIVPVNEIASLFKFPEKHMGKIFQQLVKSGLLRSERGIGGGFQLAKKPEEINLLEIIEAVEGPVISKGCFLSQTECEKLQICKTAKILHDAQAEMIKTFRKISLKTLLETNVDCPN